MSADELAAVVAELGALPMPVPVVPEPQPLSAERLAGIEARAEAATAGPWCTDAWEIYQGAEYVPGISFWIGETCRGTSELGQDRADAAFVAAARSDVPELVAEVRRLRVERADRQDKVAAAVGYTPGLEWSDLVSIVASNTTSLVQAERDVRALRARVAELEAERHSTNEALTEITMALREKEAAPLTVFRAAYDSVPMGHYSNRDAAMACVHATLANEEGCDVTARVMWRAHDPEADEPEWECWLFDADMEDDSPTGYVVTPLVIADKHEAGGTQ